MQKPFGLPERIVKVHSSVVIGDAAAMHGRGCILTGENPVVNRMMKKRLAHYNPVLERVKRNAGREEESGLR